MKYLVQETTREERLEYIHHLFACQHGDCENCGVCQIFRGTSPQIVFHDYIEGKREFQDISREFNQKNR